MLAKKIAVIIASKDFRDEEYFVPKNLWEASAAVVKTISDKEGIALGADGAEAVVDMALDNLNPAEFDAIVFIGGPGALRCLDNDRSYRVIKDTVTSNKVLGAICVSPVILAKAGALAGKRATVWTSLLDKSAARILKEHQADYREQAVVTDGKIVTANGPSASEEFARKIKELLITP